MRITLPTGMQLMDWADQVTLDLDGIVSPSKLESEDMWQDWAAKFFFYGVLPGDSPPNPYMFDDWREWAERFCDAIET